VKVKKDDTVEVIAGRDKGSPSKSIAGLPPHEPGLVEGVNRVKKHTRCAPPSVVRRDRRHRHPGSLHPRVERQGCRPGWQGRPASATRIRQNGRRFASPAPLVKDIS